MKKSTFSEESLRNAAAEVREAMVNDPALDAMETPRCSEAFQKNMHALLRKNRRKVNAAIGFKRAMAACLAVVLCLGAWLAVDVDAREAVIDWAKELFFYDNIAHVKSDEATPTEPLPELVAYYLPEGGYQEISREQDGEKIVVTYASADNVSAFRFSYERVPHSGEYWFDKPLDIPGKLTVLDSDWGYSSLFTPDDPSLPKSLSWFGTHYGDGTIQLTLSYDFDNETALKVADYIFPRGKADQLTLPVKKLTYIPEGLRVSNSSRSKDSFITSYINPAYGGSFDVCSQSIVFTYHFTGFKGAYYNDDSFKSYDKTTVSVNGAEGRLYTPNKPEFRNFGSLLVWNEGELEFALLFKGLDQETAIKMAESVQ